MSFPRSPIGLERHGAPEARDRCGRTHSPRSWVAEGLARDSRVPTTRIAAIDDRAGFHPEAPIPGDEFDDSPAIRQHVLR